MSTGLCCVYFEQTFEDFCTRRTALLMTAHGGYTGMAVLKHEQYILLRAVLRAILI